MINFQTTPISVDNTLCFTYCPICKSFDIEKIGDVDYAKPLKYSSFEIQLTKKTELWKCKDCSSWFTQNIIKESDSISLYTHGNSYERWNYENKFEDRKSKDVLRVINKYIAPFKNVLDIGCNMGDFLDYAKTKDCVTSGLEYSDNARSILKNKGHKVYGSFDEINDTFNVITAFDLVEHLYDLDSFLTHCHKLLKQNGTLILLTGDNTSTVARKFLNKWWYVSFPDHIIFPSKKGFEQKYFKIASYHKVRFFAENNFTMRSVIRKGIRLFSKEYSGWPFCTDHHIIILKY